MKLVNPFRYTLIIKGRRRIIISPSGDDDTANIQAAIDLLGLNDGLKEDVISITREWKWPWQHRSGVKVITKEGVVLLLDGEYHIGPNTSVDMSASNVIVSGPTPSIVTTKKIDGG